MGRAATSLLCPTERDEHRKTLGVVENKSAPGLPVAKTLNGQPLFSTWEDVTLDIWGPRTGKTTSRAIPAIMAAPGPPPATRRHEVAEFDPALFVRSSGTLYALSKEGGGSAGPLVTAMTVAVTEAAEGYARTQPGGRLAVPMVAVLGEAANVCKWRDLPDLYSHYGSRVITISTILQSWSQGVEVWGKEGMRKLWSAANVAVYGGGARETEFLRDLSELIGEYERPNRTVSHGKSGRQVSTQYQRERILDVADLQAMPRGRAVVLASGARATLVQTVPWMNGPHAEQIKASIAAHDPQAERTIDTLVGGVDTATPEAGRWDQHVS